MYNPALCYEYNVDLHRMEHADAEYDIAKHKFPAMIDAVFTKLKPAIEREITKLTLRAGHPAIEAMAIEAIKQAARSKVRTAEAAEWTKLDEMFVGIEPIYSILGSYRLFCDDISMTMWSFVGQADSEINRSPHKYFNLKITVDDSLIQANLDGERLKAGVVVQTFVKNYLDLCARISQFFQDNHDAIENSVAHVKQMFATYRQPPPARQNSAIIERFEARQRGLKSGAISFSRLSPEQVANCKHRAQLADEEYLHYKECLHSILFRIQLLKNDAAQFNEAIYVAKYEIATFNDN